MLTVTLTKGLPGSGKSTWAKEEVLKNNNSIKRVNKDDLRAMLDAGKWSKANEKFVLAVRDKIILEALSNGKHVIVDDTNLDVSHENHIRELVRGMANVVIKDFTDVTLETCIERDLHRLNSVGKDVIVGMWEKYLKPANEVYTPTEGLPCVVICDLDGTLANLNGRNPYDASTCMEDGLNKVVAGLIMGVDVILCSGREDKYRKQTEAWLAKHGIKYVSLLMRETGDNRKDAIIKREIYETNIKPYYNVSFVLDDRNQVVDMWRSLGLTCLQVADGNF